MFAPHSIRNDIIDVCPFRAAKCNGVLLLLFLTFTKAPFNLTKNKYKIISSITRQIYLKCGFLKFTV